MGCGGSVPGATTRVVDIVAARGAARGSRAKATASEFHQAFVLGRLLGAGSFGCVFAARGVEADRDIAVKVIDARAGNRQHVIEREVALLSALPQSACLVEFHGAFVGGGLAYFVMELCCMGLLALLERLSKLTEATMKPVFTDMLSAVALCHSYHICHRDVKCDNFLVARTADNERGYVVKMCDFGLACRVRSVEAQELTGVYGTPPYMAPEMLCQRCYSAKVDVWALGVIAYVLLYGIWPYMPASLNGPDMKAAIRSGAAAPAFRGMAGEVSEESGAWVRALLSRSPSERPSAEKALQSRSLQREWPDSVPLAAAVKRAVRCGAFDLREATKASCTELQATLLRFNQKFHNTGGASKASTNLGSEAALPPG